MSHRITPPSRRPGRPRALPALSVAGLALVALLAARAPVAAQDFEAGKLRFEEVVPSDCFLYASFAGLSGCEQAFEKSGLYQTWLEPEVQDFVRGMMDLIRSRMAGGADNGVPFQEFRSVLQGRIGVAVGDLTMAGMLVPVPGIVLAVDTGNRRDDFDRLLQASLAQMERGLGSIERKSFEYKGVTLHCLPCPKLRMTSICYAYLDNLFLAGLNRYYLQRVIDNFRDPGHGLAAASSYRRAVSKAGSGDLLATLFLNIDGFKEKLRPLAPPEIFEIAERLGVANIHGVFLGWSASGPGYRDYLYIDAPGDKKGLLRILSPGPVSPDALRLAPYNTIYFVNFNLDLAEGLQEVLDLCDLFYPPARERFDRFRAQVRQHLGFDLRDDLIASLGKGFSVSVSLPSTGGVMPDVLATINLRDTARFEKCIDRVIALSGGELRSLPFDGHELKYLSLASKRIPFSPTPTYTIEGNTLYLAGAPLVLKDAIRNRSGGGKSLADNPAYRTATQNLSPTPSSIEYMDIPRVAALVYATGAPFLQGLQGRVDAKGLPLNLALLPTTEILTRHLTGYASTYSVDEDGILSQTYSPVGLGAALGIAAKVVNSLEGVPPIGPLVRNARRRSSDATRARGLARARLTGAQALFQKAYEFHQDGNYEAAIDGFRKAAEAGFLPGTCYYNIACAYSLQGDRERAFEWLGKALEAGFDQLELLRRDPDLKNLRQDPRFEKILEAHENTDY